MTLKTHALWKAAAAVLLVALAACSPFKNLPQVPTQQPSPEANSLPEENVTTPGCQAPIPVGLWSGAAQLGGEGGWKNARYTGPNGIEVAIPDANVLKQDGQSLINLDVACDGSVTGTAISNSTVTMEISLGGLFAIMQAECSAQATSALHGAARQDEPGSQPYFDLRANVESGQYTCSWNSAVPELQSSALSGDLSGTDASFQVPIERVQADQLGGSTWNSADLEQMISSYVQMVKQQAQTAGHRIEFDLSTQFNTPWQLNQP